ncbi:MAG TPA: hypothetical protein P5274_01995 [Candidatus Paceibacterota bacterium]|nr:hypothetical protein [Candidatus Paceibacterota bacterium]
MDIGNLLRVLFDPLTIRRRVMHWKMSLTIAMVALIATVAVVAIIATQDTFATTPKIVHASNSAIETVAMKKLDIGTATARTAFAEVHAGVTSPEETAELVVGSSVVSDTGHDCFLLGVDSPVATGIALGSYTLNLANASFFSAGPANSPPTSIIAFEVQQVEIRAA